MAGAESVASMLRILLAACETTLHTVEEADDPIDSELVTLLHHVIERTRSEYLRISEPFGS